MPIIVEFNNETTQIVVSTPNTYKSLSKKKKKKKLNYQLGWHEKIGRKVKTKK